MSYFDHEMAKLEKQQAELRKQQEDNTRDRMPFEKIPKLMRQTWFPQPHSISGGCSFEVDDATLDSTIVPIAFYDEGLGAPSSLESNPENAAFAIVGDQANCFVGSRINMITAEFRFNLTSKFFDDNLAGIRFATMPIFMAFKEDYEAIDELSSIEIQDVLEMQRETTTNQGGPLYVAATDLPVATAGDELLGVNTPFLDTDVGIEAVAFSANIYYNALQFLTIKEKLKKVQGGLKWEVLNADRPTIKKQIFIRPKVKAMNKFTYFGLLLHVPQHGETDQIGTITRDYTAATQYVDVSWHIRYNEWNPEFNMSVV